LQEQATKVFEFLKDFKINLDEETYILSLRSKLIKPLTFFLKNEHHQILKPMHLAYVIFFYGLQI